jgi:hypothetical protein
MRFPSQIIGLLGGKVDPVNEIFIAIANLLLPKDTLRSHSASFEFIKHGNRWSDSIGGRDKKN